MVKLQALLSSPSKQWHALIDTPSRLEDPHQASSIATSWQLTTALIPQLHGVVPSFDRSGSTRLNLKLEDTT
jgi:hypothetical protein